MLAFEVEIDGKPLACAGVDDWAVLTCIVSANRRGNETDHDHLHLHLGGLTSSDGAGVSYHVRWGAAETLLAIGSQVGLRVVETKSVDPPARRHRSDHEVQEPSFTEEELRDLRYKDYVELKKEFEPDVGD